MTKQSTKRLWTSNLKIVNYLDVTLNLNNGSIKPYHRPDDIILYINKESN